MKPTLTLATLVLAASYILPAYAVIPNTRINTQSPTQPSQDLILAQNNFDQYRQRRHAELEQQMREEVKKPQYNNLSQAQKAQMIRDAHNALDQRLDQEYDALKQRQSNNNRNNNNRNNNNRNNNNRNNNNNDRYNQQSFDQYRQRRHAELEQQMRQEVKKPQYNNLSQAQKAQMIRDAHNALDQRLDQEYDSWRRGENNGNYNNGRYDSGNYNRDRYDRYNNRNNQPYPQPYPNNGRYTR
ncbi:MAG: hypothetical protein ACKPEN_14900 [Planktothrix sp.]|uniref:hypothetical protein n=1 Tax=Planktothrix sp. TaxID=3088171 RepID=UPI0038D46436